MPDSLTSIVWEDLGGLCSQRPGLRSNARACSFVKNYLLADFVLVLLSVVRRVADLKPTNLNLLCFGIEVRAAGGLGGRGSVDTVGCPTHEAPN